MVQAPAGRHPGHKNFAYHDGQKKYFSTGLKVKEEEWNSKSGAVKKMHPLSRTYNARINNLYRRLEEHILTSGTLDNFEIQENKGKYHLVKFLTEFIAEGDKGLLGLTHGTLNIYRATLRRLELYESINGKKLAFKDITAEFEREFAIFLQQYADCSLPAYPNT